jgi:hypothetical protein
MQEAAFLKCAPSSVFGDDAGKRHAWQRQLERMQGGFCFFRAAAYHGAFLHLCTNTRNGLGMDALTNLFCEVVNGDFTGWGLLFRSLKK